MVNFDGVADAAAHCEQSIQSILAAMRLPIFKIGITCLPGCRMDRSDIGYRCEEAYDMMHLLCRGAPAEMGSLETLLISRFFSRTGCQNIAPGNDGVHKLDPYSFNYCYVVTVEVDDQIKRRLERVRAKRARTDRGR